MTLSSFESAPAPAFGRHKGTMVEADGAALALPSFLARGWFTRTFFSSLPQVPRLPLGASLALQGLRQALVEHAKSVLGDHSRCVISPVLRQTLRYGRLAQRLRRWACLVLCLRPALTWIVRSSFCSSSTFFAWLCY